MATTEIKIDIGLNITDETLDQILYLLGIWQNHNPDKYICGVTTDTKDGRKTVFKVGHYAARGGEQNEHTD